MINQPVPVMTETLVDLLCWRAQHQPERHAYTFLLDGETTEVQYTYADLAQRAHAIAAHLQQSAPAGARALLLYPSSLEYIAAFAGCLAAGMVAVPLYPPRPRRPDPRIEAIASDARPALLLTTAAHHENVQQWLASTPLASSGVQLLATDTIAPDMAGAWQPPVLHGSSLAFLQYTSGSTAAPRGVMVTHANLLHNSALIARELQHSPASVAVSWLPMFHDFGLIGKVIQALYAGFPCILMAPTAFMQRPLRWLHAISRYRATTSYAPNFAYDLCVQVVTPQQRAALDLSTWEVAVNASEPVRAATLQRFAATFADSGFRAAACSPAYGLAEATLCVTVGQHAAPPLLAHVDAAALEQHHVRMVPPTDPAACMLVGCGSIPPEQRVVIAHPQHSTRCPPDQVGEVWLAGACITGGYWQQPEATHHTFGAYLADGSEGPFLRTGDLGFVWQGQLFITGRLKDLIIIDGRNHYPQDIERTVEQSHSALRPGRTAAFAVDVADAERLVVVAEVARDAMRVQSAAEQEERNAAIVAAVRAAVAAVHEVDVYDSVLIKPYTIPLTSSGKLQRHACRAAYLAGTLQTWQRRSDTTLRATLRGAAAEQRQQILETYLHQQLATALQVAPARLDRQQPLLRFGLDSLTATRLRNRVERDLGLTVPLVTLLEGASITQLSRQLLDQFALNEMLDTVLEPHSRQRSAGSSGEGEEDVISL
jgi:acyl-CoA synthetase (AMP-forming)/AMP-acid ligase II/aryl carrier-like protein